MNRLLAECAVDSFAQQVGVFWVRGRVVADGRMLAAPNTIGQYLIDRLYALGVRHVFGIPGDYILGLYKMLEASPIALVGTTREDAAGFAAPRRKTK